MPGPLAGLRVLELGALVAAPLCATLLADQAADVIEVEPPGAGDLFRQLAARAGVLVQNLRPGVIDRIGIGPAALCEANPRLV